MSSFLLVGDTKLKIGLRKRQERCLGREKDSIDVT